MIDKQLPEASEGKEPLNQPTDPDARAAWPWWKLKKWALRVASLFIQRCVCVQCRVSQRFVSPSRSCLSLLAARYIQQLGPIYV